MFNLCRKHGVAVVVIASVLTTVSILPKAGASTPPQDANNISPGPIPLFPLPAIPKELADQLRKEADYGGHRSDYSKRMEVRVTEAMTTCAAEPRHETSSEDIASACFQLSDQFASFLRFDAVSFNNWGKNHKYTEKVEKLMDAARMRSCALGNPDGCKAFEATLRDLGRPNLESSYPLSLRDVTNIENVPMLMNFANHGNQQAARKLDALAGGSSALKPRDFKLLPNDEWPLVDFPGVPDNFLAWDIGKTLEDLKKEFALAFKNCARVPDRELPRATVSFACHRVVSSVYSEVLDFPNEIIDLHFDEIANELLFAAAERSCYLGDVLGCQEAGRLLELAENIPAARIAWKMCIQGNPAGSKYYRGRLDDTYKLSAAQIAERDREEFIAEQQRSEKLNADYQRELQEKAAQDQAREQTTKVSRHTSMLAILTGINEGLESANERLSQVNADQAARNEQQMQQAQAQVAANDTRRSEQTYTKTFSGETSNGAIRKETLVGNNSTGWTDTIQCFAPGASLPYDSFSRSGPSEFIQNIPACPPPPSQQTTAPPPSNTVAPPVPYQKPPSIGGTVVASGTVCPASGYTFTSYGDAATGVPCTPGQPIASSSGSGSGGSGGSSSGSSAGSGIKTTPALTNCLVQSYVDGDLTVTNTCNVPVYASWWINGHGGSWTLNPGEHTGTGYSSSDVAVGGASYYVCPKNASPTDSNGNALTGPVSSYVCVVRY